MADLTSISATDPADGEGATQGASRIRATRDAILTSFAVEHALAGAHKFLSGNQAARPASGNSGRLYLNTTDNRVERDDGAAWNHLHAASLYGVSSSHAQALLSGAEATYDTSNFKLDIDVASGGLILALAVIHFDWLTISDTVSMGIRATSGLSGHTFQRRRPGGGTGTLADYFVLTAYKSGFTGTSTVTVGTSCGSGSGTLDYGELYVLVC